MNLENCTIKVPFNVPETYFSELEDKLLAEVKISEMVKAERPSVPAHYFDELEEMVLATSKIPKWETSVPEGYMEGLESQILSLVRIDGLPQPAVPTEYFENLEARVLAEVQMEALKENTVPADYFENLEQKILNKTVKTPRFTLFTSGKLFRHAAAVLVTALASYWAITKYQPGDEWENISSSAMVAYLSEQGLTEEDLTFVLDEDDLFLTAGISDSEISAYLDENEINI